MFISRILLGSNSVCLITLSGLLFLIVSSLSFIYLNYIQYGYFIFGTWEYHLQIFFGSVICFSLIMRYFPCVFSNFSFYCGLFVFFGILSLGNRWALDWHWVPLGRISIGFCQLLSGSTKLGPPWVKFSAWGFLFSKVVWIRTVYKLMCKLACYYQGIFFYPLYLVIKQKQARFGHPFLCSGAHFAETEVFQLYV